MNSLKSDGLFDRLIKIKPSNIFLLHFIKLHSSFLKLSPIILALLKEPSRLYVHAWYGQTSFLSEPSVFVQI